MGKVMVMNYVTRDGVMQGPGRPDADTPDGFAYGGWAIARGDEAMVAKMGERMGGNRAFLFGRRTYEELLASCNAQGRPPDAQDPAPADVRRLPIGHGNALGPALGSLAWLVGLLLVFVPLAVRGFRRA